MLAKYKSFLKYYAISGGPISIMALMIPDIIDHRSSDAEKKVFNWFKNDSSTDDWVVLHSLYLTNHITLIQGEADFVVLAPGLGIFALEVKGGRVERANGMWKYTDRDNNVSFKARGPFEQASDCIFSIMKLLKESFGAQSKISNLLFGHGVMMPDIVFDYESPEFDKQQVFDIRNGANVGKFILNLHRYSRDKFISIYHIKNLDTIANKYPDKKDVRQIKDFLRPNYEVQIPLLCKVNEAEQRMAALTEEQFNVIDQISDNKRIVVLGGAGTGKTLMALHTFKKALLSGESRVALFCFNSNLGDWLSEYAKNNCSALEPEYSQCYVGSFYSFLTRTIVKSNMNLDWKSLSFYSEEFANYALEAIEKTKIKFDFIIVDEFQDLFGEQCFLIFDALLNNGFNRGKWVMFADFKNQDIYSDINLDEQEAIDKLENITSFSKTRLNINCRNTFNITKEIEMMLDVKYKSIINQTNGIPVSYSCFDNMTEQADKIDSLIDKILSDKINPQDIIILSPSKRDFSVVGSLKHSIKDYNINDNKHIQFSTIHSFKGLESKVVILTDIESYSQEKLIYIAYSRARSALFVFENKIASSERLNIILRRSLHHER